MKDGKGPVKGTLKERMKTLFRNDHDARMQRIAAVAKFRFFLEDEEGNFYRLAGTKGVVSVDNPFRHDLDLQFYPQVGDVLTDRDQEVMFEVIQRRLNISTGRNFSNECTYILKRLDQ